MMFWEKWKNVTKQEKAAVKVLLQLKKLVLENIPRDKIVSIYVGGSFVRREMTPHSDVDVWVITKDMKSQLMVSRLIKSIEGKFRPKAGLSGYALWELRTGRHSRQITKKRTGPRRFMKYLPNYYLVYGKKLKQSDFKINTDVKDLQVLVKTFNELFLPWYMKKEIDFQALLKQTFWLADLELKVRGRHTPHSWSAIVLMTDKKHIARLAWKLRGRSVGDKTKKLFVARLKKYLSRLEGLC